MIDRIETGKRISILRKKSGISQSQLAERLNISTQAVSKWECGLSVPDLDSLLELSWLFDISINGILEGGELFTSSDGVSRNKLPDSANSLALDKSKRKILSSLVPYFSDDEIIELGNLISKEKLDIDLKVNVKYGDETKDSSVPISCLSDSALKDIAPYIAECSNFALNKIEKSLKRVVNLMKCPKCGADFTLQSNDNCELSICCANGHRHPVIEGVIDFGTYEIEGETWSRSLRNYEHYLLWHNTAHNPNYDRGLSKKDIKWEYIKKYKPRVILDVASGMGGGVSSFIEKIDWQCMIIFTDISYRILKYDRKYFSEEKANPFVETAFITCDCANIPFKDQSIDMVTSSAGFLSMQHKIYQGFTEAFRILKKGHCVVYDMCSAEDESSENTQKWTKLMQSIRCESSIYYINRWLDFCKETGFHTTESVKIYGELPAPDTDVFPFENEICQWMAEYALVSHK